MKKLFFCSLFLFSIQSYSQEIPKSSATDRFSTYELFKGNRMLSSVSFSGGWGSLQGFVGGINARQMFSMPNGRLFLGVQGEYNASGVVSRNLSVGLVGRYYIFNTNRWSAFAQSSFNVGRYNYDDSRYYNRLIKYYDNLNATNVSFGSTPFTPRQIIQNYVSMDAGLGLQYRVTKRLGFEVLASKPVTLFSRTYTNQSNNWVYPSQPSRTPQFKFGINYFFGK